MAREGERTLKLHNTLPAGITIGKRTDGRKQPFYVRFGENRATESFESEKARNDRAEQLSEAISREGSAVLAFDPAEWRALQEIKRKTGLTVFEIEQVVTQVSGNLRLNLDLDDAIERYFKLRGDEGWQQTSQVHPRTHLRRFADYQPKGGKRRMGAFPLYAITAEHIREWLKSLKERHQLEPQTIKHHRKNVHVFFDRVVAEKWCIENPCSVVAVPKVPVTTKSILSPREIFELLKANLYEPVVGRLVFELFGGLRCSSVQRLRFEDVRMSSRGVRMKGEHIDPESGEWKQGHKSGKEQFRQRHPPVLWTWVEFCCPLPQPKDGPACFERLSVRSYQYWKLGAFMRAGWKRIPHNRLRHCFASYLLAVTNNPTLVSRLMQHTSWKQLDGYEGVAEERDAMLVLSMTPEAVMLDWDDFLRCWEEFYQPMPLEAQPASHSP